METGIKRIHEKMRGAEGILREKGNYDSEAVPFSKIGRWRYGFDRLGFVDMDIEMSDIRR